MIITLILACLLLISKFILGPDTSLWGFSHGAFLPDYINIILLGFGLLSLSAFFIKTDIFKSKFKHISEYWLLLPAGALFYLFGQEGFLLGDGMLRIRELEHGIVFSPAEPLDTLLHSLFYSIFRGKGANIHAALSCISGLIALAGSIYYLKKIFRRKSKIYFILLLVFASGSVQLFFSYVESYSIMSAMAILFIFSSIYMIRNAKYSYSPIIFFTIGALCHPSLIVLFPALVYLYLLALQECPRERRSKFLSLSIAILILPLAAMIGAFALSDFPMHKFIAAVSSQSNILSFFGNESNYGIFSLNHIIDIFNLFVLICPAMIALPFLIKYFKNQKIEKDILFLFISSVFALIFIFLFDSKLGFARDWDLFAFSAFPISILIGFVVIKTQKDKLFKISIPLVIVSLVNTAPWILLNSNEDTAVKYAEFISKTDYWPNSAKAYLYDDLKTYWFQKGNDKKALEYTKQAANSIENDRYLFSLAQMEINNKNIEAAKKYLLQLQTSGYKSLDVNILLGSIYFGEENYQKAEQAFIEVIKINPAQKDALYYLGMSYYHSKYYQQALAYLEKARPNFSNNSELFSTLGELYFNSGNIEKALENFNICLRIDPKNPAPRYNLALCHAEKGELDIALKYIAEAEKYGFDPKILLELKAEIKKMSLNY